MAVVFQPPSLPPRSPQSYGVISDGIKVDNKMRRTAGGLVAGRVCIGRSDRAFVEKYFEKGSKGSLRPASIPSKYQTVFHTTIEKKGFQQQAPRFADHLSLNENPGPGSYGSHTLNETEQQYNASFSKQGTGGLASKTKRFSHSRTTQLGPGSYNPLLLPKQHTFNKSPVTSNFHGPIASAVDDDKRPSRVPAPNSYDVMVDTSNKSGACAAFRSQYKRNEPYKLFTVNNPAPGQYNVKDSVTRATPQCHVSSFKTVLKRNEMFTPREGPGPGAYNPPTQLQVIQPSYQQHQQQRSRHLLTFSAPAIPLLPDPPPPGPGHYEVVDYKDSAKHESSGAVFVSTTGRWNSNKLTATQHDLPGPGSYHPATIGKQSFLYNLDCKWI
ncbi:O(6)-methylguanine-induced apoptosis 2-like [Dysidea avara]|uniref:O(6)-methylguanine-induced apoptosis 2-like n=1 Tax=Dysidea avara TaxID=196820 RepID=UPI003322E546